MLVKLRGLQANMTTASNQPGQFSKLIIGQRIKSSTGSFPGAAHLCKWAAPGSDEDMSEKLSTRTPSLQFLRFSCLGKHGAALVGLPNLLKEHEILQRDDKR